MICSRITMACLEAMLHRRKVRIETVAAQTRSIGYTRALSSSPSLHLASDHQELQQPHAHLPGAQGPVEEPLAQPSVPPAHTTNLPSKQMTLSGEPGIGGAGTGGVGGGVVGTAWPM